VATIDDFLKLDIRVGRIIEARDFPEARRPAYKLTIDFGPEIGTKRSSAQLVARYSVHELKGRLVLAVVNLPTRRIGPFDSEVLTLGVPDADGNVVLLSPDSPDAVVGGRLF
jgi:tRNA-binding protein